LQSYIVAQLVSQTSVHAVLAYTLVHIHEHDAVGKWQTLPSMPAN